MKIISRRTRIKEATQSSELSIPEPEVIEHSLIIIDGGATVMSPDDIKRAEEIFRDIRRQLEDLDVFSH